MKISGQLLAASLCLLMGSAAFAQDATAPAASPAPAPAPSTTGEVNPPSVAPTEEGTANQNPAGLSMGQEEAAVPDGPGSTYVKAKFGDWDERCVKSVDGADPCTLYQLLFDDAKNPMAEISLFGLPKGQKAIAGATIIVPLETLLAADLSLQIDTAKPRRYPISWCAQIGCIARVGFTEEEVAQFRKGNSATITIVPVVAPDKPVKIAISLSGFTAGLEAVNTSNEGIKLPQ